ncbi:unnamed protein product [Linum tenue]|uniref:Uncharacterized protein n=1 Tax=Linum tenue TaxID=586396 RepID=A0AAV0KFU6_9ROSI|nr:unnamed protein product [Linum tenue]
MFPWLAFGHMLPFLRLAKIMARKGHKISFISTPRNIDRLPQLPPSLNSLITFVKLPLPPVDGLPPAAEATSDLEGHEILYLKRAYDLLRQPLSGFLSNSRPDWILFDHAPFWLPAVARGLGIPTVFFSIFIASVLAFTSPPADEEQDYRTRSIKEWLDEQKRGSVVYVAFGSEATWSQEELTEIANGLELSGLPFFWVLRTRQSPDDSKLPEGFEDRTKGRGVVWKEWAPQVKILCHDSVGGFLTHSGWSSVVEGLQFGRPLVLLICYNDQGLNAKLLQQKGAGYLVPRDERDGRFTRDSVADSLRTVVLGEEGEIYRIKAMEMKELFGDREKHDSYVHDLLGYLETN